MEEICEQLHKLRIAFLKQGLNTPTSIVVDYKEYDYIKHHLKELTPYHAHYSYGEYGDLNIYLLGFKIERKYAE